jgi:Uma2 family endonuclease
MTLENEAGSVKQEADESYRLVPGRSRPDLAIEIVFSSGGINKLEAYKRLKIPEVWFWEDGVLELYHLRGEGADLQYDRIAQSEAIEGMDLTLLTSCILIVNHVDAIQTFRAGLRE